MCYKLAGVPTLNEVIDIMDTLLDPNIDYDKANDKVNQLIKFQGYSLSTVLKEIISYLLLNSKLLNKIHSDRLANYFSDMADLENRVTRSTFGDIYMSGLVGIFKKYD